MNTEVCLNFLIAIKNSWEKSKNIEAQNRAKILSEILDKKANDLIKDKWLSDVRADPPQNVKDSLERESER